MAVAILVGECVWRFPPAPFRTWQEPAIQEALARHLLKGEASAIAEVTVADRAQEVSTRTQAAHSTP